MEIFCVPNFLPLIAWFWPLFVTNSQFRWHLCPVDKSSLLLCLRYMKKEVFVLILSTTCLYRAFAYSITEQNITNYHAEEEAIPFNMFHFIIVCKFRWMILSFNLTTNQNYKRSDTMVATCEPCIVKQTK